MSFPSSTCSVDHWLILVTDHSAGRYRDTVVSMRPVPADEVHPRLSRHTLVDGFRLVYDSERSQGSWFVDARNGDRYLDLYTFFASSPLGSNPPGIVDDPDFMSL